MFGKRKKWEVTYASFGGNQFHTLLEQGWEPFAVSPSPDVLSSAPVFIWFRRETK